MGLALILAACWSAPLALAPQDGSQAVESVSVALSRQIPQPRLPGFLRGRGWRALWGDTVQVPLLQLGSVGGGWDSAATEPGLLQQVALGWGADREVYRVLPADRDPVSARLPPNLRGTGLARVLRDLVATSHPTASSIAAGLYQSAGLEVLEPQLVFLPEDPVLPAALAGLRGRPVWIERAPEIDGAPWGRFGRIITTDSLLARLHRDPFIRLDLPGFLAARLLDLVLGDRDRPPGHWLWGVASGDPDSIWIPIARRQEESLAHADGPGRLVLSLYQPGYGPFKGDRPDVAALSATGVDFDRPLLARLEWAAWDSVATGLMAKLTDERIAAAVGRMPPVYQTRSGASLTQRLAARRNSLKKTAAEFYRLVCTYPDIELSDGADQVTLSRTGEGDLELVVSTGGRETLRRRFRSRETRELRLHLNGGVNEVSLRGVEQSGVGVRITAGSGTVGLRRDGSKTHRVVLYAPPRQVHMEPDKAVRLVPRRETRWIRWQRNELPPLHPDWGTRTTPIIQFGIGGDLGVVLGGGVQWLRYGFGQPNYRQRARVEVHYTGVASRFGGTAGFERRDVLRNLHLSTEVALNRMAVLRYFGEGNDTRRDGPDDSYRVDARDLTIRAAAAVSSRPELEFEAGPVVELAATDTVGRSTLLEVSRPYGSGRFDAVGVQARFRYAPARSRSDPGLGVRFTLEGSLYPEWLDVTRGSFAVVRGESRLAWVPRADTRLMLAGRLGGAVGAGTIPFRQAFRLGGASTLRGYQTDRFTGDRGAAFGSLELRLRAARAQVGFVTFDLGLLLFGDAGRVWSRGQSSSTVHSSAGGGVWAAPALGWIPALDAVVLRADLARSVEGNTFSFGTGFRF